MMHLKVVSLAKKHVHLLASLSSFGSQKAFLSTPNSTARICRKLAAFSCVKCTSQAFLKVNPGWFCSVGKRSRHGETHIRSVNLSESSWIFSDRACQTNLGSYCEYDTSCTCDIVLTQPYWASILSAQEGNGWPHLMYLLIGEKGPLDCPSLTTSIPSIHHK